MSRQSILLGALVPLFIACGGAPSELPTDEGTSEDEIRTACADRFAEVEKLRQGITWNDKAQDAARAPFLDALGIESGKPVTFVYKDPTAVADLKKKGEALKLTLTGKFKPLVSSVDAVLANLNTYNLKGKTDIAPSFRCLSSDSQRAALQDGSLDLDERTLDLTTARAKSLRDRIMRDVNEESNIWGDTILEGPYATEGDVAILSSEELRISKKRVALRVTFGAPAVNIDSCERAADDSWPANCERGTIQQTLYFDTDLERILPMEDYADFYE